MDKTLGIVENYRTYIDVFISEPDKGVYEAMNKGIVASTGGIVYYLNADDKLYDRYVTMML